MAIPKNITAKHIETAISIIDRGGVETLHSSYKYELLHQGKRYPPKDVIRVANEIANGYESLHFSAGDVTNNFLIKRGFKIVLKGKNKSVGLNYTKNKRVAPELKFKYEDKFEELELKEGNIIDFVKEIEQPEFAETEREHLAKIRIGQSVFKQKLLEKECKCTFCQVEDSRFLIASHIKPWNKSKNRERLDVNNGFLLCPNRCLSR